MILEIGCNSFTSAQIAFENGADRIELFSDWHAGGCTPSLGSIKACKQLNIPIYAMIRPRGGNFNYTDSEFEIMKSDIIACKKHKVDGIVFGILTNDQKVDSLRCAELINLWNGPATFHRAFDSVAEPFDALETLISLGFERILTSGQHDTAIAGIDIIENLLDASKKRIQILPGAGINLNNVGDILKVKGIEGIHTTANSILEYPEIAGSTQSIVDGNIVKELRTIMDEIP